MLHAAIMTGMNNARKSQQSAKPDLSLSKQPVRKQTALHYDENINTSRNKCIFEPRPELTYNDINNFYQKPANTTKRARAPVKYIGSHTDSQLNYSVNPSQQPQVQEQKLFRRESIIASWHYLKKEQERALGGHKSIDFENIPPRRTSKVTRSHSAKENTNLRRFSSKRKSVIYSYDPNRKVLNEEYKFASDTESESDRESFAERQSKTLSNFDLELYPYQKSSSFDKLKSAKIPSKLKSKMKAAGEREGEGSGREMHRDRENSSFRERSKESDGRKEGSREKDGESHRDRSKDSARDKDSENRREGLQVNTSGTRLPSRSQSPALTDLRMDQIPVTSQEPTSTSTSSKHSSERSHHSKSHSKDLGNSPGAVTLQPIQQQPSNRSMEDSPQKQLHGNLSSLAEYGPMINSPGLPSGYQSANISYVLSSDEYSPLQTGFRDHLEFHPHTALLSSLAQQGQFISEDDHLQGGQQTDERDGAGSSGSSRAANAISHLNNKVERTKELIKLEQTFRDDNVNEYLKLAANADKQQLQRIKAVFEKKNQKSANSIAQLQKKLDGYHKRIKNWETHGSSSGQGSHRQPREMLRDMGQGLKNVGGNIRDGITGLGGSVMSKPREFAHLIKNKFGSADNINQMAARNNNWAEGRRPEGEGAHTLPGALRGDQTTPAAPHPSQNKLTSEEGSECSSVTSESIPGYQNQSGSNNLGEGVFSIQILAELQNRRTDVENLFEKLKTLTQEVTYVSSALQEERFRCERLEEQINDLTELHQNEVENLKQALADVEEKVQYQSEERVRDIHEMLELCQTKISKMEHQAMQQQQYVNLEGIEGFNARVLAVKLINVVLTVLQVVLLLVATAAGILMPFLRTRDEMKPRYYNNNGQNHQPSESLFLHTVRILTTSMVVIGAVFILKQWPEVWEISTHLMEKLRKTVVNNENINR